MITVQKTPISVLILMMVIYLIVHMLIGIKFNEIKKEKKEKPGNEAIEKQYKWLNFLFRWFPAIYLIIVLSIFYF